MKTKVIYQESTETYRLMPYNYWLASNQDGKLVFDSWDGMSKRLLKNPILKLRVMLKHFSNPAKTNQ